MGYPLGDFRIRIRDEAGSNLPRNAIGEILVQGTTVTPGYLDEAANADDPILALVPAERRSTLIARHSVRDGRPVYVFDIHMQGEQETVFFEV